MDPRPVDILLVEDNPTDVLMMREALEAAKVLVNLAVVEDGDQALDYLYRRGRYADATLPDLILLDLNLPRTDGREVLEQIKQDGQLRMIPVIVVTISRALEDIERSYKDHANAFISKPVDFPNFVRAVQSLENFWFAVVTLPPEGRHPRIAKAEEVAPAGNDGLVRALEGGTPPLGEYNQLLHAVSHDLREPVRGIAGTIELLRERYADQGDAKADEFLRHAVENTKRLECMLEDLLTLSRIQTRGGAFARVSAGECLDEAIAHLERDIAKSGAVITRDELPTVTADRDQLTLLFEELLRNAIKFSKQDALPQIHVGAKHDEASRASVFSVRDEGIGIDPRHAERIFGIFQRLYTRAEYPGTGIGLALCKRIVERHGGTIEVDSRLGQGTVFRFRIPDTG